MKESGRQPPTRSRPKGGSAETLAVGQKLRDVTESRTGVVLDFACQYSHPKAEPVYNYLVRWDDGEVQAISEAALAGSSGLQVID